MIKNHCCKQMTQCICELKVVYYNEVFDEYGMLVSEDLSYMILKYCPWCGKALPTSRREDWFNKLESMGFDDPWYQEIPTQFKSSLWREIDNV